VPPIKQQLVIANYASSLEINSSSTPKSTKPSNKLPRQFSKAGLSILNRSKQNSSACSRWYKRRSATAAMSAISGKDEMHGQHLRMKPGGLRKARTDSGFFSGGYA